MAVILFIGMILYDVGRNILRVGCCFRLLGVSDVCENMRTCCERFLQLINVRDFMMKAKRETVVEGDRDRRLKENVNGGKAQPRAHCFISNTFSFPSSDS